MTFSVFYSDPNLNKVFFGFLEPFVPGQPPPPTWIQGQSPSGSLAHFDYLGSLGRSSRASLNRGAYEEFQRPAPPPYSSISKLNQHDEEGTYLV